MERRRSEREGVDRRLTVDSRGRRPTGGDDRRFLGRRPRFVPAFHRDGGKTFHPTTAQHGEPRDVLTSRRPSLQRSNGRGRAFHLNKTFHLVRTVYLCDRQALNHCTGTR